MKLRTVAAVALAALLASAGAAAAMPGNAPDHAGADEQAPDHADDPATNETAAEDGNETVADDDADAHAGGPPASAADHRGPPTDLPAPVPEHVAAIHDLIRSFLGGSVNDLGPAVSDATPGNESADG